MKVIDPEVLLPKLDDAGKTRISDLANRQKAANTLLMKAVTFAGGQIEDGMRLLPKATQTQIEDAAKHALTRSYDVASRSRKGLVGRVSGDGAHKVLATISGALGGLGGLPTALAELPVATTVIFRAVQDVAAQYGEDPTSDETRIECLRVFGSGGPGEADDGIDTSFIGARLSLSGVAINTLISRIAPKFATVLGQKLATQAVPVLGAAAGAGTNYAFIDYYVEIAHVHFGLRKEARLYGEDRVLEHFHRVLAQAKLPANRP